MEMCWCDGGSVSTAITAHLRTSAGPGGHSHQLFSLQRGSNEKWNLQRFGVIYTCGYEYAVLRYNCVLTQIIRCWTRSIVPVISIGFNGAVEASCPYRSLTLTTPRPGFAFLFLHSKHVHTLMHYGKTIFTYWMSTSRLCCIETGQRFCLKIYEYGQFYMSCTSFIYNTNFD